MPPSKRINALTTTLSASISAWQQGHDRQQAQLAAAAVLEALRPVVSQLPPRGATDVLTQLSQVMQAHQLERQHPGMLWALLDRHTQTASRQPGSIMNSAHILSALHAMGLNASSVEWQHVQMTINKQLASLIKLMAGGLPAHRHPKELQEAAVVVAKAYADVGVESAQAISYLSSAVKAVTSNTVGAAAGQTQPQFAPAVTCYLSTLKVQDPCTYEVLARQATADLAHMSATHLSMLAQGMARAEKLLLQPEAQMGAHTGAHTATALGAIRALIMDARARLGPSLALLNSGASVSTSLQTLHGLARAGCLPASALDNSAHAFEQQLKQGLLPPGDVAVLVSTFAHSKGRGGRGLSRSPSHLSTPQQQLLGQVMRHINLFPGAYSANDSAVLMANLCSLGRHDPTTLGHLVSRVTQQVEEAHPSALVSAAASAAQAKHPLREDLFRAISHRVVLGQEGLQQQQPLSAQGGVALEAGAEMEYEEEFGLLDGIFQPLQPAGFGASGQVDEAQAGSFPWSNPTGPGAHQEQPLPTGTSNQIEFVEGADGTRTIVPDARTSLVIRNLPNTIQVSQLAGIISRIPGCKGKNKARYSGCDLLSADPLMQHLHLTLYACDWHGQAHGGFHPSLGWLTRCVDR